MAQLTQDEFWMIQVYFEHRFGFTGSHDIFDIDREMMRLHFFEGRQVIMSLIEKNVLSISPDRNKVKFTDYGIELFHSMLRAQEEWHAQPIVRVSDLERDQILVRAGETFKGNRVLRGIFGRANRELCMIDPYVGTPLFDLLESFAPRVSIRIITSERLKPAVIRTYSAFRGQFAQTEMRTLPSTTLHDRFILWDGVMGFHVGHSLKDLGKKDTQLDLLSNPAEQVAFFEERWKDAQEVT